MKPSLRTKMKQKIKKLLENKSMEVRTGPGSGPRTEKKYLAILYAVLLTYILVISVSLLNIKFLTISLVCNLQTNDFKGDTVMLVTTLRW